MYYFHSQKPPQISMLPNLTQPIMKGLGDPKQATKATKFPFQPQM